MNKTKIVSLAFLVIFAATSFALSRRYWIVDPATFATSGSVHTHVSITGYVNYTRIEDDGDLHIRIVPSPGATNPFFIAECIPALPCARPALGTRVTVSGISRRDPEHRWWEVHPVEWIQVGQ